MNEKLQLIKEIEQASDTLVKEALDFLLFTKNKTKLNFESLKKLNSSDRNTSAVKSQKSLKNLLLEIPNVGEDADFERKPDRGRDITL